MKRAEVLLHGMLRECTLVLQHKPRLPLLPWEARRASEEPCVLTAKIGGVELQDGGEFLVICDGKRYTVHIEMVLGLSNHGRVVLEWPDGMPPPEADPKPHLQCW